MYTITVANAVPSVASSVTLAQTLADYVRYDSFTSDQAGVTCALIGQVVNCSLGTIAAGTAPVVRVTVKSPTNATMTTTTSVSTISAVIDPNPANNTATATTTLTAPAAYTDLTVSSFTASPNPVTYGNNTTFTVTVRTISTVNAAGGVSISLGGPSNLVFLSGGNAAGWNCRASGGIDYEFRAVCSSSTSWEQGGAIPAGGSVTLTVAAGARCPCDRTYSGYVGATVGVNGLYGVPEAPSGLQNYSMTIVVTTQW